MSIYRLGKHHLYFQEEPSRSMEENLKWFIEDTMEDYRNCV